MKPCGTWGDASPKNQKPALAGDIADPDFSGNVSNAYNWYIEYVRDKRSPTPKSEAVSRVMSANRAKDSKPEMTLRRALWAEGLRGYRLH